jgi:hypothetical protein
MVDEIAKLLEERSLILDETPDDERVDSLSEKIWTLLAARQDFLPVEFTIESLTKLGSAPSILYDDNGHFTIGGDGSQNLPTIGDDHKTKETVFDGYWIVKPGGWKKTVREALKAYFQERE